MVTWQTRGANINFVPSDSDRIIGIRVNRIAPETILTERNEQRWLCQETLVPRSSAFSNRRSFKVAKCCAATDINY
jgi:hypothetical protein